MPGGKHENMQAWSPEEDGIILSLVERLGPKWSEIVHHLPGRTVSSIRNRYQRIEKGKKLRAQGDVGKNRCHACGEPKRGHVCKAKLGGGPKIPIGPVVATVARPAGSSSAPGVDAPLSLMPPLRRTRSGGSSGLTPGLGLEGITAILTGRSEPLGSTSWGMEAPANPVPPMPMVQKSSVSFFSGLANELFDNDPTINAAITDAVARGDGSVPPQVARVVSGEAGPPKVTRSVSSFLRGMESAATGPIGGPPPAVPSMPLVSGRSRQNSSNLLDSLLENESFSRGLGNISFSNVSFGANAFGDAIPALGASPKVDLPDNLGADFKGSGPVAAPPPPSSSRKTGGGCGAR